MSTRRVLVLGGAGSGHVEFAENLLAAGGAADDPVEISAGADHALDPYGLGLRLGAATPVERLLVTDLPGWLRAASDLADDASAEGPVDALLGGLASTSAATVVLVSTEVSLGRPARADADDPEPTTALAELNRTLAGACDRVALVIAGRPIWLPTAGPAVAPAAGPSAPAVAPAGTPPALPATAAIATSGDREPADRSDDGIPADLDLQVPDESAAAAAGLQVRGLDFAGAGLGTLTDVVRFAGGTQGRATPHPWETVRVLLLHGVHAGAGAAGDDRAAAARRLDQAHAGAGPFALLAAAAGAGVHTVGCPPSGAMESGDVLTAEAVDEALALGWRLAGSAVDEGADAIVLAALGVGSEAAAVALTALAAGGEPAALLDRVVSADGAIDDASWMARCVAVRDALHRVRTRPRDPRSLLAMVGGGDLAVATGVILGAAFRRTPVLVDGPVGLAAALAARDLGPQSRLWLVMPDHGGQPLVRFAGDVLGLHPVLHLKMRLGEGATALAAVPLLRGALTVAAGTPATPPPDADGWSAGDLPTTELPLVKRPR